MKKLSLLLVITILFLTKTSNIYAYSPDPKIFITELVNDSISKLSNKNISKKDKKDFIAKVAIENVDINALGLYTLGDLRKTTDKILTKNFERKPDL